jgi:hypothetical protein
MSKVIDDIKKDLVLTDYSNNKISKIEIEPATSNSIYWSDITIDKTISPFESQIDIINKENLFGRTDIFLNEGTSLTGWKNTENRSARFVEIYENSILVECLIDKEANEYAEIEYKKSIFSGMALYVGKLVKLCFFERRNQVMMEVIDDPNLIDKSDFPNVELSKQFKNLVLKKRK